ncbi:MAG: ABC transporter ATP-binding protein [Bacteroidales bacterium]|nr:ABC transporter ATP-binding protein [Bacteroidota bacterium]NLN98852.1 ABC transporter ATP-binding protein [Bacteroidales bacterium]
MKDFKTCMKGLNRMAKPVRGRNAVSVLVGIVRILASLTFVWASKRLVDIVTGVVDAPLYPNVFLMVGIMLVQISCNLFSTYWMNLNVVKTQNSLRLGLFAHVLNARWSGREAFRSGDTINRLEEDIRVLTELICNRIPEVLITSTQLLAASAYLMWMEASLLWVLVVLMVVAVLGSKLFFGKLRQLTAAIRAQDSEVQQLLQENLQNRVLVLTLFGVGHVVSRLASLQDLLKKNTVKRLNYNAVARGFMSFGFMAGYAAAFLWGIFGIKSGAVTFGMMTAFLQLVGQIQRPIADLGRQVPAFIKALTSIERLLELEDLKVENYRGDIRLEGAPGIDMKDVTFAYEGKNVLENFSHMFRPGTFTVIAGPTGVGKSTLTRLMLGLLTPEQGKVLLYSPGGQSHVADVNTRCNFMYVPQGNSLMSGTIRENMRLAKPDATDAEIEEALNIAAAGFVYELPDGLETLCGEGGTGLSEGQSQRIAIARALLHEGGVMILDEATSALDSETEERLLKNIASRYKGKKTVIFISHRPAAARIADEVLNL